MIGEIIKNNNENNEELNKSKIKANIRQKIINEKSKDKINVYKKKI